MEELTRLRIAVAQIARALNASGTDEGLTPSQASVLGLIAKRGPLGLKELSDLEGINPTMLSRVVGALTRMGLIERNPDPADLRTIRVQATPSGRSLQTRIKTGRTHAIARCMEQLPPASIARLIDTVPDFEALAAELRHSHFEA